jgi:hypothetical protein
MKPDHSREVELLLAFPLLIALMLGAYLAATLWAPAGLVAPWWDPAVLFGLYLLGSIGLILLATWSLRPAGGSDLQGSEWPLDAMEQMPEGITRGKPRNGRTPPGQAEPQEGRTSWELVHSGRRRG